MASTFNTQKRSALISTYDDGLYQPYILKTLVETSLDSDKAQDITVIELDDQAALADYMIVASGTSSRHILAMASKLKDKLLARGIKNIRIEGADRADWVVLDMGDIIVHLFRPEVREFYNIEKMWSGPAQFNVVEAQQSA